MTDAEIDSSAYVEIHTLKWGHSDSINTLSFSPDSCYLASGGADRSLLIWDVQTGQLLFRRLFSSAVMTVIWHPSQADTVIVGCEDGEVAQIYHFTLTTTQKHSVEIAIRSKVQCLCYAPQMCFLAIGMGSEVHLTRERSPNLYEGDWKLPSPSAEAGDAPGDDRSPVSVHFAGRGRQIIVSYAAHGIVCWEIKDRKFHCRWRISVLEGNPVIGHSALSPDEKSIVVHNVNSGVDLYSIADRKCEWSGSYRFEQAPRSKKPLQVSFVQGSRGIVCGTSTGNVCVWYTSTKDLFQKLHHDEDVIKAIDTVERGPYTYIGTGAAGQGQLTQIKVWRARMSQNRKEGLNTLEDTVIEFLEAMTTAPIRSREAVRRCLATTYRVFMWFTLALILGWGYAGIPWSAVWAAAQTMLLAAIQFLNDVATSVNKAFEHWTLLFSDWLRAKVTAWLQIKGQPLGPLAASNTPNELSSTMTASL